MRYLLGLLLILSSGFCVAQDDDWVELTQVQVSSAPSAPAPTLTAKAVLVQDEDTQQVVYSLNSTESRPIASITKLMAMWIVHELQLPADEKVKVLRDQKYLFAPGMFTLLRAGEVKTRAELLERALVTSDNLAAYSVAAATPGGVEDVVRRMNERALELGMQGTNFVEPTGMMEANRSTPEDLAKLIAAASADPSFRALASKQFTEYTKKAHPNTNPLLVSKPELVDTSKTGFIRAAGKCVVSRLFVNGKRYLVVLLQAPSTLGVMHDYAALYAWLGGTEVINSPKVRPVVSSAVNKKPRRIK